MLTDPMKVRRLSRTLSQYSANKKKKKHIILVWEDAEKKEHTKKRHIYAHVHMNVQYGTNTHS